MPHVARRRPLNTAIVETYITARDTRTVRLLVEQAYPIKLNDQSCNKGALLSMGTLT